MKQIVLILILVPLLYTLTAGGHLFSPDEEVMFRTTRSLCEDFDLAIEPLPGGFATRRGRGDLEYAQYGVGQPILAAPFYLAGARLAPRLSVGSWKTLYGIGEDEPDGARGYPYTAAEIAPRFALSFFNIALGAAVALLLYLILAELTRHESAAFLATVLYAFGTLAWVHSRHFFSEQAAVFFILLAWHALLRAPRGPLNFLCGFAGFAAGFAALVRMDSVVLYPGLAVLLLGPIRDAARASRPHFHPWFAFCMAALLCGAVIPALNYLHFGSPLASGYSDQPEGVKFSTPVLAGLYGNLFSSGRGLFLFSPALMLFSVGIGPMFRRDPRVGTGVLVSAAVALVVMSKWQNWSGGWDWGPRHIFMIQPFLAIPVGYWLAEFWSRARQMVAVSFLLVGVAVQLLGASQDPVEFHRLYYANPDPRHTFHVLVSPYDDARWSGRLELALRSPDGGSRETLPLGMMPAPIIHSVYIPQSGVWYGYPRMWRDYRRFDNMWYRAMNDRDRLIPDLRRTWRELTGGETETPANAGAGPEAGGGPKEAGDGL